eukprot:2499587-Rhodomonas_salina.1
MVPEAGIDDAYKISTRSDVILAHSVVQIGKTFQNLQEVSVDSLKVNCVKSGPSFLLHSIVLKVDQRALTMTFSVVRQFQEMKQSFQSLLGVTLGKMRHHAHTNCDSFFPVVIRAENAHIRAGAK